MKKEENGYYCFNFMGTPIQIDISWENCFKNLKLEIEEIEEYLDKANSITPEKDDIFKVFGKPMGDIKVIILGQDPYYQKGIATGRAFEVKDYKNWCQPINNTSLINIVKELYSQNGGEKLSIEEIRNEIKLKRFDIASPDNIFNIWENNGVFLLNTSLTCEIDNPNSHKVFWQCFTKKIIKEIAFHNKIAFWLLWGDEAQKYRKLIEPYVEPKRIVETAHPATNNFVGSGTFRKVLKFCKVSE